MTTRPDHTSADHPYADPDPRATLPLHPWADLRAATGMLLGADDYELLAGNPRAKHMLHGAWLHGAGVVWGLGVRRSGEWDIAVEPGLAVDGWGRELHVDAPRSVSARRLLEEDHDPGCGTREVVLCLVLRFDACLDGQVPALLDPCDVTRESTDWSRIVERARLDLVRGCPEPAATYRRVRVLLGLADPEPDPDAEVDATALAARAEVAAAPSHERPLVLLERLRCLAALDAADIGPAGDPCSSELFPVAEEDAGVLLACLRLTVKDESGCPEIVRAELDTCHRPTLVPTGVLTDLLCGLAPGLLGWSGGTSLGPQVVPEVAWERDRDERYVLRLPVTAPLVPGSVRRAVTVSSLSESDWVVEDLMGPARFDADDCSIVVTFADRPAHPIVRIVVRGTGSVPVYGADPVAPLAGVVGDDPDPAGRGRDAVLTVLNPVTEGEEAR